MREREKRVGEKRGQDRTEERQECDLITVVGR